MNKDSIQSQQAEITWKNILQNLMLEKMPKLHFKSESSSNVFYKFLIFLMLVFIYVWGLGQLTHVGIKADDWEFMIAHLPEGLKGFGSPWQKTLWEGRWINYFWSFLNSYLPVNLVYAFFISIYALFCWMFTSFFSQNKYLHFLLAALMFLNPSYGALSLWPATMTPSLLIGLAGLFLLRSKFFNGFMFVGLVAVLLLSYSPVASMFLVLVLLGAKNRVEFFRIVGLYLIGYILGVAIIYFMNLVFHGHFGIQPENVRLHLNQYSLFQIQEKFVYFKDSYLISLKNYTAVLSAAIVALAFIVRENSKKVFLLASIFLTLLGIDLAFQIYSGLDIPPHSRMWPWAWSLGVFYVFVSEQTQKNKYRYLGGVFALVLGISGYRVWEEYYTSQQIHARYHEAIAQQVALSKTPMVQFCRYSRGMDLLNSKENAELRLALWKKYKIELRPVEKEICKTDKLVIGLNYVDDEFILRIL